MRAAVLVVVVVLGPIAASADTPRDTPAALEIDREGAPPGRAELSFDAGGAVDGWAIGVTLGHLARPIVIRDGVDERRPVDRRTTLGIGGAVALGDAVVVDARWSGARQTGDRLLAFGMPRALDRWVPRDLALGARIRVVGAPHGSAAIRGELTLPTGDDRDLAGEPSWTLAWALIARAELPAGITAAATAGIRLRGAEVRIADRLVGDEVFGGVGVLVPLPAVPPLWWHREQVKLTGELVGVLGNDVGGEHGPSPAEARIGVVTRPRPDLATSVRAGAGLRDEIGAPQWRVTVEVTYQR